MARVEGATWSKSATRPIHGARVPGPTMLWDQSRLWAKRLKSFLSFINIDMATGEYTEIEKEEDEGESAVVKAED